MSRRSFLLSSTALLAGCSTVTPDPPARTFGEPVGLDRTVTRQTVLVTIET